MDPDKRHYVFNLETTKIELHFDKAEYDALSDAQKKEIKSAFLWSNRGKCWVSRAKEPNLWRAKDVANKLGFTAEQREGERLSYGEQLERQAERAEARADRYEGYAGNAVKRADQLQKEFNSFHGDIAFFTQPNINSSGGRAFTNYRNRVYARYEKGFEEYRKSDYFRGRAQTARETASNAQLGDKAYLDRRIKECKKEIRDRGKNAERYEKALTDIENGKERKKYSGEIITADEVTALFEREMELIEKAMDKQGFLENCLDDLGGIQFSKDNIKPGYIVRIGYREECEVTSTGPVNVFYKILTGGAKGLHGKATYAEINEIVKAVDEKKREAHPFKVGEKYTAVRYEYPDDSFRSIKKNVDYEIIKASDTTIRLQPIGLDEKAITRKPVQTYGGKWRFSIDDSYSNTFYKEAPVLENSAKGQERPSTLDKLDAAKVAVATDGAAKAERPEPKKSHDAEL